MSDKKDTTAKYDHAPKKAVAAALFLFLLLVCVSFTAVYFFYKAAGDYFEARYLSFSFSNADYDYDESTDELNNPGGGYYYLRGYLLYDDRDEAVLDELLQAHISMSSDLRLVLLEINLLRYRDCALSDAALAQTDQILSAWEDAGFQIILRFLYDWDGNAAATEPSDVELVKTHMAQTAPIVNSHADAIYTMQGIFVGNYAEMNGGTLMTTEAMCALMEQLDSVIDPTIFLSVRTPAQRRTILAAADAFPADSSLADRLGLYNDGMLGSEYDLGTYGDIDRDASTSLSDHWLRTQELEYQDELCRLVPNGGEVTIDNSYNDLDAAVSALAQMHVSYLSCMYDEQVLDKWKDAVMETDDGWNGTDGYTYIGAHLSYRYRCSGSAVSDFDFWTDDAVQLDLTLTNTGFSCAYEPLSMRLFAVSDADGSVALEIELNTDDFLTLCSGESAQTAVSLPLRGLPDGGYRLYLMCTDSDGSRVALASRLPLTDNGYELASFSLESTPTVTPSAHELIEQYVSHLSEKSFAK